MTTVILDIKFNIQMKRKSLFSSEYPSLLAAADAMFNKFHQMSDKKNSRAHNNKKKTKSQISLLFLPSLSFLKTRENYKRVKL